MKTVVLKQLPARFDMCGKFLGYPLKVKEGETISPGLAKRLYNYALNCARDSGFDFVEKWECTVETIERERYDVTWRNPKGGEISVVYILIGRGGWPVVDHGFTIAS